MQSKEFDLESLIISLKVILKIVPGKNEKSTTKMALTLEIFNDAISKLNAKIDDNEKQRKADKKELIDSMKKQINQCIMKNSQLEKQVNALEQKLEFMMNFNDRRNNLIVNGIPFVNGERPTEVIKTIEGLLGYEHKQAISVHRFNGSDNKKRPILLTFDSEQLKSQFFNRYLKIAKTLTLDKIFDKQAGGNLSRVYVQPDLSKMQYEVNKEAVKMKKDGDLKQVRLQQCGVLVTFTKNNVSMTFASKKDLTDELSKLKSGTK